jgi:cell division protein FtsZ|tara:strand:+ start:2129 stop:3871 length:1743 start_codon:yes stop_codon:yes gene_type:complete
MSDNTTDIMRFELPTEHNSIIKVIGVGGGGSNAVNYMYEQGINGVDFVVCNTDAQALDHSPVPLKIQLGATLTEGRGAGAIPEVGRNAAVENLDDVMKILTKNTTMVFVTAGMGGGTGTGAAPIIAKAARDLGILTVGIVTIPFMFEGRKRKNQAEQGLKEMRDSVDTLLVIKNDKLRELYGNLTLKDAFSHADEVLCTAAKGIAEVITLTGEVNVDMNDVNTVMKNSGVAIMGSGKAQGEDRAMTAVTQALESPLLNDNDITGAEFVLLNVTHGADAVTMDEVMEITDYIQDKAGMSAEVIWGYGEDTTLGDDLCVTVIATGFSSQEIISGIPVMEPEIKKHILEEQEPLQITSPIEKPTLPTNASVKFDTTTSEEQPFLKGSEEQTPEANTPDAPTANEAPSWLNETEENDSSTLFSRTEELETEEPFIKNTTVNDSTPPLSEPASEEPKEEVNKIVYELDKDDLRTTSEAPKAPVDSSIKFTHQEPNDRISRADLAQLNQQRENRVKEFSHKLRTPGGLAQLENEPSYVRRNVKLDDIAHSSESQVSRYTLSEETDEQGNSETILKDNNSFLHDNVD